MYKIYYIGEIYEIHNIKCVLNNITYDKYERPFYQFVRVDNLGKFQLNNQQLQDLVK